MIKIFTVLAVVLATSLCFNLNIEQPNLTNKEILQQALNGAFEENKLPDPTTIVPCIDEATAKKIVDFVGTVLEKAAKGSITDIVSLVDLIKGFGDQIPESVKTCLDGNAEFKALGLKYGIDDTTDTSVIEKKVITYVTLHYLQVHKTFGILNDEWKGAKYYQTGYDGAAFGHTVLGSSKNLQLTNKQILQQALDGLFGQNKLPASTTIVPCIDEATAKKIVDFIGTVLEKAAKGSISDLLSLVNLIKSFGDQIPEPVKTCLDGNAEFKALGLKYGIDDATDTSALEKKVITYVTLHYLEVHKQFGILNDEWKAAKYYQTGFDGAAFGHKVLGVSDIPNLTNKEILQQALNGAFEENKLPDPTTIVPCIDEATAKKIVDFVGTVLEKAAKGSITDIVSLVDLIKGFGDQIPESVKTCLDGNAEFKALGLKYGIDDTTDTSVIEKKVITYVTLHYLQVHKTFGILNDEWKGAKYYQTGYDGAAFGHTVLGITVEEIKRLIGGL